MKKTITVCDICGHEFIEDGRHTSLPINLHISVISRMDQIVLSNEVGSKDLTIHYDDVCEHCRKLISEEIDCAIKKVVAKYRKSS